MNLKSKFKNMSHNKSIIDKDNYNTYYNKKIKYKSVNLN